MDASNNIKNIVATTEKRQYFTIRSFGVWMAYYQPMNPKTGKSWQATRMIGGKMATESEALAAITVEMNK